MDTKRESDVLAGKPGKCPPHSGESINKRYDRQGRPVIDRVCKKCKEPIQTLTGRKGHIFAT